MSSLTTLTFQHVKPGLSVVVRFADKARECRRGDSTPRERNAGGEPHNGTLRVVFCAAVVRVARRSCSDGYTSLLTPCHSGTENH